MELLSKVGRYEFLSEPFHCDFSSHLFMGHLGNHLLNAADFHSNDRGYGMNYLMPRHKTWVLSRLAIEMTEMPKSYDKFYVETWVENAMKYLQPVISRYVVSQLLMKRRRYMAMARVCGR